MSATTRQFLIATAAVAVAVALLVDYIRERRAAR